MSKIRSITDARPVQQPLFTSRFPSGTLAAGRLRTKEAVREALTRTLDGLPCSRDEFARELSRLVGEDISVHSLNNWCSGKSNRRFPLEVAKAVAMISGKNDIIEAALKPEFDLVDQEGQIYLEYGVRMLRKEHRQKRDRELAKQARRLFEEQYIKG